MNCIPGVATMHCCQRAVGLTTGGTRAQIFQVPKRGLKCFSSSQPIEKDDSKQSEDDKPLNLPARGYFSIANTKADVYSKAGDTFDPRKKPGRYEPEFIWNTNWQESLEIEESLQKQVNEAKEKKLEQPLQKTGFLSLSRLSQLDDVNTDLSNALKPRPKPLRGSSEGERSGSSSGGFSTRTETKKLERVTKASKRVFAVETAPSKEVLAMRAEEAARYEAMKSDFQLWTVALTAIGFGMTYVTYSQDIAFSYLLGAASGFLYLRLLSRSVDGIGAQGLQQGLSAAAGQPRFLVPVIAALAYNRWNQLYADQFGVHLELLPVLVGFFTYKIAIVGRQGLQLLQDLSAPSK